MLGESFLFRLPHPAPCCPFATLFATQSDHFDAFPVDSRRSIRVGSAASATHTNNKPKSRRSCIISQAKGGFLMTLPSSDGDMDEAVSDKVKILTSPETAASSGSSSSPALASAEIEERGTSSISLTFGDARFTVRRHGDFTIWRKVTSVGGSHVWRLTGRGRVCLPRGASHVDFHVHRESSGSSEVRWGLFARLLVRPAATVAREEQSWLQGLEHGFVLDLRVRRSVADQAEITFDMEASGQWFGGAHLMRQLWPLNLASWEVGPWYPFDNGPNGLNTLIGAQWVTSSGLLVIADPRTPTLHVGMNSPVLGLDDGW